MIVAWSRVARDDLTTLREYIAEREPAAAARIATRILIAADYLASHPYLGRIGREAMTRELVVAGTPYILVYQVRVDRVEVVRVLHGAQRWPEHPA